MNPLVCKTILNWGTRFVVLTALLFIPAGTFAFSRGWAFLAVYFLPQIFMVAYFLRTNPAFVERRLKMGPAAENRSSQKLVMALIILSTFASIAIAGTDYRFRWSNVPFTASIAAGVGILLGVAIQFRVFLENTFASATIEIAADQKVIATGPYGLIRHPMYCGTLLTDFCLPLALGSWWAFLPLGVKVPVVVYRLLDEEVFLRANLTGYTDYCRKVPHRLLPAIW